MTSRQCIYRAHVASPKCLRYLKGNSLTCMLWDIQSWSSQVQFGLLRSHSDTSQNSPEQDCRQRTKQRQASLLHEAQQHSSTRTAFSAASLGHGRITQNHSLEVTQEAQLNGKGSPGVVWQTCQLKTEHRNTKTCSKEQLKGLPVLLPAVVRGCLVQFLLPSETIELLPLPFCSPFFPHRCLSGFCASRYSFFSGKIRRSIHALAFRKENLAFPLIILNIFSFA